MGAKRAGISLFFWFDCIKFPSSSLLPLLLFFFRLNLTSRECSKSLVLLLFLAPSSLPSLPKHQFELLSLSLSLSLSLASLHFFYPSSFASFAPSISPNFTVFPGSLSPSLALLLSLWLEELRRSEGRKQEQHHWPFPSFPLSLSLSLSLSSLCQACFLLVVCFCSFSPPRPSSHFVCRFNGCHWFSRL